MISHVKTAIGKAVEYVNPGQTVVIACDQPLFALAKTVEWAQKDRTWEDKLEVMLGGLHIEQAALKAFGTWLAGSGWVEVLSQARITTAGKKRNHLSTVHGEEADSISTWRSKKETTIPIQFELIKEDGAAIGLTENPSVLLRWMVSGPELARKGTAEIQVVPNKLSIFFKRNIGCQDRGGNLDNQHFYLIEETRYRTQKNGTGRSARKHGDRYGAHCPTLQCPVKSSSYVAARPAVCSNNRCERVL
ncbi:hypothetical protein ACROYT_G042151 [Oculina patagonica]